MNVTLAIKLLFLICFCAPAMAGAGAPRDSVDLADLLPQTEESGRWTPVGEPEFVAGEDLYLVINGGAEIYHEYGFNAAVFHSYRATDGTSINLEIYEMEDEGAAYGMYTFKTGSDGKQVELGQDGWFESYYMNFWNGRFLVTVIGLSTESAVLDGIEAIAKAVDSKFDSASGRPRIVSYLPKGRLQTNGVTYLKGNLALFNQYLFATEDIFGVQEGVVGKYDDHAVMIFQYDDGAQAKSRYEIAKAHLKSSERFGDFADRGSRCEFRDPQLHRISVTYDRDWIVIILGDDHSDLDEILGSLNLPAKRTE
jgi:hypothetical protein